MFGLARDRERGQLGLDERRSVERLLVPEARSRFVSVPAPMTRQAQRALFETALVAEPAERLEPGVDQVFASECATAADQRL